ncbi:hypothetical protein IU459_11730 [Nocardia amamiensis]|uniref:Uncharacterized protein n=1 Tax=Nocardia amamiensis TaxID=404578 RepID=A0ABS0CNK0_9NOCA|nr:hypothetical protein [Nocardia amamiensis]MBF6298210.1 hypothetical protein [Nocardia amamiensis]
MMTIGQFAGFRFANQFSGLNKSSGSAHNGAKRRSRFRKSRVFAPKTLGPAECVQLRRLQFRWKQRICKADNLLDVLKFVQKFQLDMAYLPGLFAFGNSCALARPALSRHVCGDVQVFIQLKVFDEQLVEFVRGLEGELPFTGLVEAFFETRCDDAEERDRVLPILIPQRDPRRAPHFRDTLDRGLQKFTADLVGAHQRRHYTASPPMNRVYRWG